MTASEQVLVGGAWRDPVNGLGHFRAEDPVRGVPIGPVFPISGTADIESAVSAAVAIAAELAATPAERIADFLDAYAAAIDADADALVALAHAETALPVEPRLRAVELPRASGLALKTAADKAGVPIYAELSSINPVFLLPGALAERGDALAQEFFASGVMGSGQFCTNPGVVVVPAQRDGDAFVVATTAHFAAAEPKVLFSRGVRDSLSRAVTQLLSAGAELLAGGNAAKGEGYHYEPTLLTVDAETFLAHAEALQTEAFGPVSLLVRAADTDAMARIAAALEGNLTGTLYRAANGSDDEAWAVIAPVLRGKVGRLIANKMPTGVAVSPAMNHGGPYPSTSHAGFTAVGMPAAIHRFTALHSYDNVPDALLPIELRDRNAAGVQRCVDGRWSDGDIGDRA